jgi:hypothetical protein
LENRVLRKLFGSKRDEVMGEWRRLHNEEFYYIHLPKNYRLLKPRIMRWVRHVARMGNRRGAYTILVGRPKGKVTT